MGERRSRSVTADLRDVAEVIWTAREARRVLSAWRKSGMSVNAFARRNGLTPQRVLWWRKRLGEWGAAEPAADAAGVVPAVVAGQVVTSGASVVFRVGGSVVVEVADPALVAPGWLSAVLVELSGKTP